MLRATRSDLRAPWASFAHRITARRTPALVRLSATMIAVLAVALLAPMAANASGGGAQRDPSPAPEPAPASSHAGTQPDAAPQVQPSSVTSSPSPEPATTSGSDHTSQSSPGSSGATQAPQGGPVQVESSQTGPSQSASSSAGPSGAATSSVTAHHDARAPRPRVLRSKHQHKTSRPAATTHRSRPSATAQRAVRHTSVELPFGLGSRLNHLPGVLGAARDPLSHPDGTMLLLSALALAVLVVASGTLLRLLARIREEGWELGGP
jgi:hypothetical protein